MPQWHRTSCKDCGTRDEHGGGISGSGYCLTCAQRRKQANIDQLIEHRGPYFDHWRRQCLAAFGGIPMEEKAS